MKIDWIKFNIGQKQFQVKGIASTENRKKLVEEAIGLIQKNAEIALKKEFLGYKNYAQFSDQRCDCEYGYGPKHGTIVFSIKRSKNYNENKNHDEKIYFLKCFRDAPGLLRETNQHDHEKVNIQKVFREIKSLEMKSSDLQEFLDVIEVDVNDDEIVGTGKETK